jgi:hypothetical protein
LNCELASLSRKSKGIVTDMIAEINNGTADESTKTRFNGAFRYILNAAAFPKPVIAMKIPSGLTVVDGSHRMGAFCALQMLPDAKFQQLKVKKAVPDQDKVKKPCLTKRCG